MSGICDTCKRNKDCRKPMDGMDSCRLYVSGKESNYDKLFGTPERAARTLARMCQGIKTCATCPLFGVGLNHCKNDYTDFASIAKWLRSDVE